MLISLNEQDALCEDMKGIWTHHERQAPQKDIRSIYTLSDGQLFIDTKTVGSDSVRTFHTFNGEMWHKITLTTDNLYINSPFISNDEDLFYFIDKDFSLVSWDYSSNTVKKQASGKLIQTVAGALSNDNKSLYISSSYINSKDFNYGGIYKFEDDIIKKIRNGRAWSLAIDCFDNLWSVHKDADSTSVGLWVFDGNKWSDITADLQLTITASSTVQSAPDSSIWINNFGQYGIYKDGEWTFHDGGTGPEFISFDLSNGVWGYNKPYIYKLGEDGNWNEEFDIGTTNSSNFLTVAPDSTVWTIASKDIYCYSNKEDAPWTLVRSNLDLASDTVTSLAYTQDGWLVCGHGTRYETLYPVRHEDSKKEGVSIFNGTSWFNYSEGDGVRFKNVYDLLQMENGDIMAYTDSGYKIFDGNHWDHADSLFVLNDDDDNRFEIDMIEFEYDVIYIATNSGLLRYDFEGYAEIRKPDSIVSYHNRPFFNFFIDDENLMYVQNEEGFIISYNKDEETKWEKLSSAEDIKDYIVDHEKYIWAVKSNHIYQIQGDIFLEIEDIFLQDASLIFYDLNGRIWASGYNNTGYLENGEWHRTAELSDAASDEYALYEEGKIALNAIEIDNDRDLINYYGVFEYCPDTQTSVSEQKTNSFSTTASYPNPFNSSTTISFDLPHQEVVNISIYNINGQLIKTLANRQFPQGGNSILWDSKSNLGASVASGIYFYRIKTESIYQTGKMLLLR